MIEIVEFFDNQKYQRPIKIENRNLKHTHKEELAKNSKPITEQISELNESNKNYKK